MPTYTIRKLPLKRKDVLQLLETGEEIAISDRHGAPYVPILFADTKSDADLPTVFKTVPCACSEKSENPASLPSIFIHVPLEQVIDSVPEDALRFEIAHEYMHTGDIGGFFTLTEPVGWFFRLQYFLFATIERCELEADYFAMVVTGTPLWAYEVSLRRLYHANQMALSTQGPFLRRLRLHTLKRVIRKRYRRISSLYRIICTYADYYVNVDKLNVVVRTLNQKDDYVVNE